MGETLSEPITLNIKGKLYLLHEHALVMGIMNLTPDSFYVGSRTAKEESALVESISKIVSDGADIIDIGACSTRPGAKIITEEEEWKRLHLALKVLQRDFPNVPVSLDTFRSGIAQRAVEEYGVALINDVSGGTLDPNMFKTMAHLQVPYILMHMRGTPATMTRLCDYDDVTLDVIRDLEAKKEHLRAEGFSADIIMDPGFGFSKDQSQNYVMLRRLQQFKILSCPLLVGISRKRMIWGLLGTSAEDALNGTSVLNTIALLNGAHILRVHDVKACVEVVKIVETLQKSRENNKSC